VWSLFVKLSDLRSPVISALRWTVVSRLLMQAITWTATIVSVRLLTPSDYGIVTVATLLSNYLIILGEAGFGSAIVQRQTRDRATLVAVFSVLAIAGAVLAGIVFVLAPFIGTLFHEPRATPVMRLAALQFLLLPFGTIPGAVLQLNFRFKELGIANLAGAITSSLTVVGLALAGAGPFALVGGMLLSHAVRVFFMQRSAQTPIALSTNLGPARSLVRYSALIVAGRSAWYWYTEADNAVVARFLGTNVLGVFSVAKNLIQAPLDRIGEVANAVSFSAYSRIQEHSSMLSDAYLKSLRVAAYVVFPLFWGLGCVAEPLIRVAFGPKWAGAVVPMQLFSFAMPLRALQNLSTPVVHAVGRPDLSFIFTVCAMAVIIPLLFFGVMNFGVAGAAGSWAIGYPLVFALSVWLYTKPLSLRPIEVWRLLARPAVCGIVMTGLVLATVYGVLGSAYSWQQLSAGIAVGALSYVSCVALLDRSAYRELTGLIFAFARR
jgi:O-antigen/teichoic acid export membrane protein